MIDETSGFVPGSQGVILSAEARIRLATQVRTRGERSVRAALRVSRTAFDRVLAGLPVRLGTLALVERGLEQLEGRAPGARTPARSPDSA